MVLRGPSCAETAFGFCFWVQITCWFLGWLFGQAGMRSAGERERETMNREEVKVEMEMRVEI